MNSKNDIVLRKMIKYCEDSIKYIDDLDFESFSNDELKLTFSIFSLSQLGELVSTLDDDIKQANPDIPWTAIRSIRNRIVHDYDGVQYRIIWDTLKDDIPPLIKKLKNI
jgi:uncharacterized protein with HEPN domain